MGTEGEREPIEASVQHVSGHLSFRRSTQLYRAAYGQSLYNNYGFQRV